MKIAILYSGAIRTLIDTIENNLNYFSGAEIHLYFSIWDHMGYADKINSPDYILSDRSIPANTVVSDSLIQSMVPEGVIIKAIKIEKYDPKNYSLDLINSGIDNLHAQYYKIWDCFTLLDKMENYDFIVRMRCDILLNKQIWIEELKQLSDDNKIVFTSKIWYNHPKTPDNRSINEMFWISGQELMGKACNIYNNTAKMNQIIKDRGQAEMNYGESVCYMNLEAEDMADKVELFDFDYVVLR